MDIVNLNAEKASRYIARALAEYLSTPVDSDFDRGFLAALIAVYREGLGKGVDDDLLAVLDRQLKS